MQMGSTSMEFYHTKKNFPNLEVFISAKEDAKGNFPLLPADLGSTSMEFYHTKKTSQRKIGSFWKFLEVNSCKNGGVFAQLLHAKKLPKKFGSPDIPFFVLSMH